MTQFRGKNNYRRLSDQFFYRVDFFQESHARIGPEVFDFDVIEFQMYGAIDLSGSSIYPKENRLKLFSPNQETENSFLAFDFVVDMFEDVKNNINLAMFMGEIIIDNEFLKKIEVKRAYESPKKLYKTSLANIMIDYNEFLESSRGSLNNITSFSKYVNNFLLFLKEKYQNTPLTFTGWSQTSKNSLFSTGLAISIADLPFDDDHKKYDKFMLSSGFEYFKKVCLNRGFRVHHSIPYIMVADLGSPAIKPYLVEGIPTILDKYYNKCYNMDYILLRNYIKEYYNIFLERNPYFTDLKICQRKIEMNFSSAKSNFNSKTIKSGIFREPISNNPNNFAHNDYYWMNFYLEVRNIELGMLMGEAQLYKIKKYLKNYKNILDKEELISYIDSNFRLQTFNKPFGFYYVTKMREEAKKEQDRKEGITGGSTVVGGGSSGGY